MDDAEAERRARNDAVFREANEQIRDALSEHAPPLRRLPFICECADPACTEIVRLTLGEYAAVREHPRRFVTTPAHREPGAAAVVEEHEGYIVVEKVGAAGVVAERLAGEGGS